MLIPALTPKLAEGLLLASWESENKHVRIEGLDLLDQLENLVVQADHGSRRNLNGYELCFSKLFQDSFVRVERLVQQVGRGRQLLDAVDCISRPPGGDPYKVWTAGFS